MPLTEQQYQDLIVLTVGDDAQATLATQIALLWAGRASTADLDLRSLYVKRDAIDLMLGQVRRQVTFRGPDGSSVSLSDLFDHLTQMREATETQITAAQSGAGGGVAIGALTATAPLMPPSRGELNPNAQRYRGDTRRWRP